VGIPMNISPVVDIFQTMLMEGAIIILPAAGISIIIVVLVAVIMAMMQIQDQSLTFFPKTLSVIAVLLILGPWMLGQITRVITGIFDGLPALIGV